jgi:outer membrane protein OmpA-like peptidoglycan-associated protein
MRPVLSVLLIAATLAAAGAARAQGAACDGGRPFAVFFEANSYQLSGGAVRVVEAAAGAAGASGRMTLTAHTDGAEPDVSADRARAIRVYLLSQGVGGDRITTSAAVRPAATTSAPDPSNRKVDICVRPG